MGSRWFMTRNDGGEADGEGIFVEYRKHIPSRRGDSRIARPISANAVRTGGETPPLRICRGISHCRADCTVPKPPSEREGDRDSGGRSLRNFNIRNCCFLRILPQSPSAPAPSRREPNAPPNVCKCRSNGRGNPSPTDLRGNIALPRRRISVNAVQTGDS